MDFNKTAMYHIGITPVRRRICHSHRRPRTSRHCRLLEQPEFAASNREYTVWAGKISGRRVLVASHGIGGPSMAICVRNWQNVAYTP